MTLNLSKYNFNNMKQNKIKILLKAPAGCECVYVSNKISWEGSSFPFFDSTFFQKS